MIKVGSGDIKGIMVGENPVSKVYRGSEVVWSAVKRYGGIAVLFDNASYPTRNGMLDAFSVNNDRFISAIIDTGSSSSKSITWGYTQLPEQKLGTYSRYFNDLSAISKDYWALVDTAQSMTKNIYYRYIVHTVYKSLAQYFYVYDNTNQQYLLKGSAVE